MVQKSTQPMVRLNVERMRNELSVVMNSKH